MPLSSYALEQMGFRRRLPTESIEAVFHGLYVYEARGFTIENDVVLEISGLVAAAPYELALASSLNSACRKLLSDDFTDDEDGWKTEHKCTPPFILVHIGPTAPHAMTGDFLKVENSSTTTYDGFALAKAELRNLESVILPSVISALTCAFSTFENPVKFTKIAREVFGRMPDGGLLHDIRINVSASGYTSRAINSIDAAMNLQRTKTLASTISPKISGFFHLGIEEEDPLKKFLYFFLTIERQTHFAFATADHTRHMESILQYPDRVRASSVEFFEGQLERWTTLRDRFVWCTLSVWTHLTDTDVESFKDLKKLRDKIAHGELASPPADAVIAAERLAIKLQIGPADAGIESSC